MSAFPRTLPPDQGSYRQQPISNTFLRSLEFASRITTRAKLGNPRWRFSAAWQDEASTLTAVLEFLRARQRGETFTWFDPSPAATAWKQLEVGYGNASTTTFDLPGVETTAHAIHFDGVLQPSGWSVSAGAGTDGRDRLSFVSPPSSGARITADFTGVRGWSVIVIDYRDSVDELLEVSVEMESIRA